MTVTISPEEGCKQAHGAELGREASVPKVEEVNATGGINGRRLELLIKDDRNTREGIIEADEAQIAQGVMLIIGSSV